mmetsp:Transcript_2016/g.5669  ORF Transcript_2016/g.5669 Transcript_2016/m.5669 type:complete len:93 (-) Transcript_2016:187-465(-)
MGEGRRCCSTCVFARSCAIAEPPCGPCTETSAATDATRTPQLGEEGEGGGGVDRPLGVAKRHAARLWLPSRQLKHLVHQPRRVDAASWLCRC